jgi:hypothetical protein
LSEHRLRKGLNDNGNLVRFPRETFLLSDQIGFEAHPASMLMGNGGRKAAQGLSMLDGLLSRISGLSISNSILLYKLLFRSVVDYACAWYGGLLPAPTPLISRWQNSQSSHRNGLIIPFFLPTKSEQNREFCPKISSCGEPRLGRFEGTCVDS